MRIAACCFAISMVLASTTALSQTKEAQAEALFHEGVRLMNEGQFEKACPKFEESQKTDPSSGTLLNLASCYEQTNRPASAWATYKAAAALAEQLGQSDRVATAKERIAALEPSLPKLRITAAQTPGLMIKRNGLDIGASSLGEPMFVDPGEHTLEASAPGFKNWSKTIAVPQGAGETSIAVPALEQSNENSFTSSQNAAETPSTGLRTASYVTGGLGIAGLAVGAIFGGLALRDRNEADPMCPDKKCSKAGFQIIEGAKTKALASSLGFGIGGAALGAGIVLFVLSRPSSDEPNPAPNSGQARILLPTVDKNGGGFVFLGRF